MIISVGRGDEALQDAIIAGGSSFLVRVGGGGGGIGDISTIPVAEVRTQHCRNGVRVSSKTSRKTCGSKPITNHRCLCERVMKARARHMDRNAVTWEVLNPHS